ncbi:MAG: sulfurtransferase [Cellulophaga sp.]|uniref:sulfurtransferase n=1 Tax=unclassified Cellulophaga TaxID=2634405 RepID=UPI0026E31D83|nr:MULTISPECIES: sulfurtransferase [unclassified Cellulophaga]MDO6490598.1 sulfurtransferase [Cellulophaga sp. 2_MG-2023]MDO6494208.1 sulfurtransferase [Cellulophaga sp. 3_MG-2023]
MKTPLISAKELEALLVDETNIIILDASPATNVSGLSSDLENLQIKGARKFNIKANFSDASSDFPNTIPSAKQFQEEARKLGIKKTSKIVVYDNLGVYTSPRVWWLFTTFGHSAVTVLDGGLPEWVAQGLPTEETAKKRVPLGNFIANQKEFAVVNFSMVKENTESTTALVVDARSAGRFNGTEPEPRAELASGSIPGSVNLPFTDVLEDGKFKSKEELKVILEPIFAEDKPLVFSCGSGLTACVILLASKLVDDTKDTSVYDGSWTEWVQLYKEETDEEEGDSETKDEVLGETNQEEASKAEKLNDDEDFDNEEVSREEEE